MDIIETVLMFLYKLTKTKLMTKGAKLASAASADALPVFEPRSSSVISFHTEQISRPRVLLVFIFHNSQGLAALHFR